MLMIVMMLVVPVAFVNNHLDVALPSLLRTDWISFSSSHSAASPPPLRTSDNLRAIAIIFLSTALWIVGRLSRHNKTPIKRLSTESNP
jgi:hypothetical protein